jgi:CRP-like cAMP-binding protein
VRATTPLDLLMLGRADFDRLVRERYTTPGPLGAALERERLLVAMPLFADLDPRELGALAARLEPLELAAGQEVVRQGEPGDRFYLIRDGQLAVLVAEQGQAPRQVASLGPGEYFGEIALLHDQPRSATVTTVVASRLFALRKVHFDALLREHRAAGRDLELVASRRQRDQARKARKARGLLT